MPTARIIAPVELLQETGQATKLVYVVSLSREHHWSITNSAYSITKDYQKSSLMINAVGGKEKLILPML